MRRITENLKKLKSSLTGLLNNYSSQILTFAVTFVAAFFIITLQDARNATNKMLLMEKGSDLMIENHFLNFMTRQQDLLIQRQRLEILHLERVKEALLKGNYTQYENKNTQQTNSEMVGHR
jgi:hypothetical protein